MKNGRWLQRDRKGYVDGANLYHAFGGNAMRNSDPAGEQFYEPSDAEVLRWAGMDEADVQEILAAQRQSERDVAIGVAKGVHRFVSGTLSGLWQLVTSPRQTATAIGGAWSAEYQSFRASGSGVADAVGGTAADQVLILVGADGVVSVLEGTDRLGNRLDLESSATALTESGIQAALVLVPASKAVTASSRPLVVLPERLAGESAAAATSERLMLAAGRAAPGSSLSAGLAPGEQLVFPFYEPAPLATIQTNKLAGDVARDLIAAREAPALTEHVFVTVGGVRRVDVLKVGDELVGIESKVGRTSLGLRGSHVRQELARDWWIRRQGQVDRVIWEFTPSETTGLVGPSPTLLEKLRRLGFEVRMNP